MTDMVAFGMPRFLARIVSAFLRSRSRPFLTVPSKVSRSLESVTSVLSVSNDLAPWIISASHCRASTVDRVTFDFAFPKRFRRTKRVRV